MTDENSRVVLLTPPLPPDCQSQARHHGQSAHPACPGGGCRYLGASPWPAAAAASASASHPEPISQQQTSSISPGKTTSLPLPTSRLTPLLQDLLKTAAVCSTAIMTSTGTGPASMSSARIPAGQIIVSQSGGKTASLVQTGTVVTNRQLTPHQLALLKQQALKKNAEQQLKQRLQAAVPANTSTGGAAVPAVVSAGPAVTVSNTGSKVTAGLARGHNIIRQAGAVSQTVRNISDPEFKALLSKQPVKVRDRQPSHLSPLTFSFSPRAMWSRWRTPCPPPSCSSWDCR